MYTASELERASMALDEPMKTLENSIMSDIVRRIRDNGEITAAADWQITRLVQLGMGMAEIQAAITEALRAAEDITETLFTDVISAGYARDKSLYEAIGKVQIPFEENEPLQQLISSVTAQTNGTMHNITQSLGFAQRGSDGHLSFTPIADYYQRTLDKAMLDISSGAFDYNTVLKRTVKEMTDSGLRTVDYATGWSNRVNVAAHRAIMTGMTQLTAKVNEDNAEQLETEWFEISWHSGARPSHWWGGKWYTKEQLTTICKLGDVQGLCGANCYHDYSPVIPGISEPTYTEEELAELNRQEKEPIEYNSKQYTKYEALQRQRRLETTMRAQRQEMQLLKEGGADEDDIINCRARYHGTSQEYTAFSKAMGLPQQRERVFADGLGNIMQGKYTGGSGKESPVRVPPVGAKVTDKVTAEERKELLSRDKVVIADKAKNVEKVSAVEETSGFKQAKTIEEAEKFALENGVRHVDYSDLPLETANLLNEAAMTLPEDIRPAYIGSGKSVQKVTGKKFSRKEKDYYGVHMDVLQMHFGEYPNIEYDFEGGNVVGISTAYKTPEKIHKSKVEGNKAYAEKHDGHTQFFNEDGRSTAFHEMGHIYADKKGIPEGFASDAERWLKESKCDMLKSTDEAWAEAWGAYHTKNPDLPVYIAEYVEKASNAPIDNLEDEADLKKLVNIVTGRNYKNTVDEFIEHLPDIQNKDVSAVLKRANRNVDYSKSHRRNSYFNKDKNTVYLDKSATPSAIAHELFHKIDHDNNISLGGMLDKCISNDYEQLIKSAKNTGQSLEDMLYLKYPKAFEEKGRVKVEYRGISDIISGMTGDKINLGFHHNADYWKKPFKLQKETFAQYGRMYFEDNDDVIKMLREILPETTLQVNNVVSAISKFGR